MMRVDILAGIEVAEGGCSERTGGGTGRVPTGGSGGTDSSGNTRWSEL